MAPVDRERSSVRKGLDALEILAPALVTVFLLHLLGWGQAFTASIPAVSDLTGHFSAIEALRTRLLPAGTFRGWAPEWFAGLPVYYFYFPLPGLVTALLGLLIPPPMALRIVAFGATLSLPWVLLAFGRWAGFSRIGVISAVLLGGVFLTAGSPILGGNLASTIAGEFSYGWSLAFAILFLGRIGAPSPDTRRGLLAGVLLAASILSHVLPALAAIVASSLLVFRSEYRRALLTAWAAAAGLTAVWTVPMLARLPFAADLGWAWEPGWSDFLPLHLLLVLPAALLGLRALSGRPALQMLLMAGLFGAFMALAPQTLVMRARLLPVYFLSFYVLAGAGVGEAVRLWRNRPLAAAPLLAVAIVPWLVAIPARGTEPLQRLAALVVVGTEAKPGAGELRSLQERLSSLPPGRLHWEYDENLSHWGGVYAFAHLPRTTGHSALTGLLKESAPISTAVAPIDDLLAASPPDRPDWWWTETGAAWDPVRAVELLEGLGVRYLVTVSAETTAVLVHHLAGHPPEAFGELSLFDLGPVPLVTPICVRAWEGSTDEDSLRDFWLETWRPGEMWPVRDPVVSRAECSDVDPAAVSDLDVTPERIAFRTSAVGAPHLVRVSYFPNWKATGGRGPVVAGPGLMVVVPEKEDVVLEFTTTWAERLGWGITWLAVGGIFLAARSRRRSSSLEDE